MSTPVIQVPSPPRIPYPGGCVTEPAFYALDYLLKWRADVTVAGTLHHDTEVLPLLKAVLADPASYAVTAADAQAAREQCLQQAGQALEQEGGQRAWLEREI